MKKVWALIIVVLLAWGCSGGTDGNTSVKVTGKVVDESGNPVSGVTVSAYKFINTKEIDQIRSEAPGVGFDGYERLFFNSSNQNSLGNGKTNSSGNFSVEVNSSSDFFNIKLSKNNYGQSWVAGINSNQVDEFVLVKDSVLHDDIMHNHFFAVDSLVFKSNKSYRILDNETVDFSVSGQGIVLFEPGTKLILGENSSFTLNPGSKLLINGTLDNPVAFISNSNASWNNIEFNITGDEVSVNGLACSNGAEGIIFNGSPGIKITNSVFNDIEGGLTFLTNNKIEINNTIISNCEDGYLLSSGVDSSSIENSIFINTLNPLRIEGQGFDEGQGENPIYSKITNNYLKNSDVAIDAVTVDLSIKNNSIMNSNIGINLNNGCRGYIENNHINIINQIGINIISLSQNISWGKYPAKFSSPDGYFTNNNIINSNTSIYSFVNDDESNVLCQNNYWGTTNFDTLEIIIKDDIDFGIDDPMGEVDFTSYKTFEIPNIGAQ